MKWPWHRNPDTDRSVAATMTRRLAVHKWDGVQPLMPHQAAPTPIDWPEGRSTASAPESDAAW